MTSKKFPLSALLEKLRKISEVVDARPTKGRIVEGRQVEDERDWKFNEEES